MESTNPLLSHIRKPKPILNLSSGGKFWPEGSIEKANNIIVYPMTGQDEILLLNTSTVLLGSVLAEIIESCIPEIHDVWSMPRTDLDSIMIAIRCASYNDSMNVQYECPQCKTNQTHSVNLLEVSHEIVVPDYNDPVAVGEYVVWLRPITFKENFQQIVDRNSKLSVIQRLQSDDLTEDEKQKIANESLKQITEINIRSITNSIDKVVYENQTIDNQDFIQEWLLKTDRETFSEISDVVSTKNDEYQLPTKEFICKNSDCDHKHKIEIDFNPADFLSKGD